MHPIRVLCSCNSRYSRTPVALRRQIDNSILCSSASMKVIYIFSIWLEEWNPALNAVVVGNHLRLVAANAFNAPWQAYPGPIKRALCTDLF